MPTMTEGTRWYVMTLTAADTAYLTPFAAFMEADKLGIECDIERFSAVTGRREVVAHRRLDGVWELPDQEL